jgi:hypothetical protein
MPEKKPFYVEKKNGKNILTNSSNERTTTAEIEVWQVKFTEAFENEYCMQWLDDKHVNQAEQARRHQRENWESTNVKEGERNPLSGMRPEIGMMALD